METDCNCPWLWWPRNPSRNEGVKEFISFIKGFYTKSLTNYKVIISSLSLTFWRSKWEVIVSDGCCAHTYVSVFFLFSDFSPSRSAEQRAPFSRTSRVIYPFLMGSFRHFSRRDASLSGSREDQSCWYFPLFFYLLIVYRYMCIDTYWTFCFFQERDASSLLSSSTSNQVWLPSTQVVHRFVVSWSERTFFVVLAKLTELAEWNEIKAGDKKGSFRLFEGFGASRKVRSYTACVWSLFLNSYKGDQKT